MNNQRQFLLGVFFVTALSLLAAYTLFFTDTVNLFGEPILVDVYFPEAYGLRPGDPVLAAGLRIGRVKDLEPKFDGAREKRIEATLSLDEPIELLVDYSIEIRESTLLGGRHVHIEPGMFGGPPHDAETPLLGSIQKNPLEALADLGDLFNDNRENVASILGDVRAIVSDVRAGKGTVGKILVDETMADDLAVSIKNIRDVTARIDAGEGMLGMLINDAELKESVRTALESIETIATDLQAGKGLVGRLIYDEELANEVQRGIEAFSSVGQRIERGEGIAGRLLANEELAQDLEAIIRNVKAASADVEAVAATIRSGEGTVGKLLMDQELYDEAMIAVKLLTRTLEDYREAAPVSAFTSVLFSAF